MPYHGTFKVGTKRYYYVFEQNHVDMETRWTCHLVNASGVKLDYSQGSASTLTGALEDLMEKTRRERAAR